MRSHRAIRRAPGRCASVLLHMARSDEPGPWKGLAELSSIGMTMVLATVIGLAGGYVLDGWLIVGMPVTLAASLLVLASVLLGWRRLVPADDLLTQKLAGEGAESEDLRDVVRVPSLREHRDRDHAADLTAEAPRLADSDGLGYGLRPRGGKGPL